jgi:hypothetical protein
MNPHTVAAAIISYTDSPEMAEKFLDTFFDRSLIKNLSSSDALVISDAVEKMEYSGLFTEEALAPIKSYSYHIDKTWSAKANTSRRSWIEEEMQWEYMNGAYPDSE